jgi:hypothetical protein
MTARPRDYNHPARTDWNDPIHYITKCIDNHTNLYIKTGNIWHEQQAVLLRGYILDLKRYIQSNEINNP